MDKKGLTLDAVRQNAVGKSLSREELERFHAGYEDERMIPTRHGETHVYYYMPEEKKDRYPVLINLHGGGFVKGHRDQDVVFCRNMAQHTGCVIVDVDYKTAPEYRYPYALEECYDVTAYVAAHPEEFHADSKKIILIGHSAGGNFVCGVEFMAIQSGAFQPCLLIMDYPPVDMVTPPQERRYAYAPYIRISVEQELKYMEWYIDKSRIREITASPVLATGEELESFPPVLMILAEEDSLTAPAVTFAAHLIDAGVTVTAKRVKGSSHGFTVRRTAGYEVAEKMIFEAVEKAISE